MSVRTHLARLPLRALRLAWWSVAIPSAFALAMVWHAQDREDARR